MFTLPWKNLNIIFEKRSSTTSKQNIHINYQRTRLCDLQIFLSMYFVYGLKTLKSCIAICSSNITLKTIYGSFCIKKNHSYRDKIFAIVIRNMRYFFQFWAFNWFIWTLASFYSWWLLLNPEFNTQCAYHLPYMLYHRKQYY